MLYQLSYLGDPRRSVAARSRDFPWRVWSTEAPVQSKHGPGHPRSRYAGSQQTTGSALQDRFTELDQRPGMARPASLARRRRLDRPLRPALLRAGASPRTSATHPSADRPLAPRAFIRVAGDETDALALVFVLRDLSERFSCRVDIRDPDNPIAKLRIVDLVNGRLADQRALESILVRRPIFKRMRDGERIEMYPPRALGQRLRHDRGRRRRAPERGASSSTACAIRGRASSKPRPRRCGSGAGSASSSEGGRPAGQPRQGGRRRGDGRRHRARACASSSRSARTTTRRSRSGSPAGSRRCGSSRTPRAA